MKQKVQLFPSGISLIDSAWGGFYRGGTYLLVGPHKSGRTLLGLQFTQESARKKDVCLYFTSMRPKELLIHAASIDFDLQHYMNQNMVIVVRVSPPSELNKDISHDEILVEYLNDIVTVVQQYQPSRIVFDELTPFIGFDNIKVLQEIFLQMTENIEEAGITSLFILGEPVTSAARNIVNTLGDFSTGMIYLQRDSEEDEYSKGGKISIVPNIGHTEGKFESKYIIQPNKGLVPESAENSKPVQKSELVKTEGKYKKLADLELPEEVLSISNIYNVEDFNLILNNQIAVYKSTGKEFSVISFRLEEEAEKQNLLTITQLQNAIRLSSDKKDKLCAISNKVIVLMIREDKKGLLELIAKVKSNLPMGDLSLQKKIMQYISVYAIKVDENIEKSDDIMNELLSEEIQDKKKFRII